MKMANDLRWMNSGPLAGLGEIELPALQPGSSIMPGKVNPVIPEALAMVCAQVIGNDTTITIAGQSGNFQLNVMLPVVALNLLQSIEILANASRALADKAIAGFKVREDNIRQALDRNPILVTALNSVIGYDVGAATAKQAYKEGRPIIDVALETTGLSRKQLERTARSAGPDQGRHPGRFGGRLSAADRGYRGPMAAVPCVMREFGLILATDHGDCVAYGTCRRHPPDGTALRNDFPKWTDSGVIQMNKRFLLLMAMLASSASAQQNTDISAEQFTSGAANAKLSALGRQAAASGKRLVVTAPQHWHAQIAAKIRAGGNADVVLKDGFYETVLVRIEDKAAEPAKPEPKPEPPAKAEPSARRHRRASKRQPAPPPPVAELPSACPAPPGCRTCLHPPRGGTAPVQTPPPAER